MIFAGAVYMDGEDSGWVHYDDCPGAAQSVADDDCICAELAAEYDIENDGEDAEP